MLSMALRLTFLYEYVRPFLNCAIAIPRKGETYKRATQEDERNGTLIMVYLNGCVHVTQWAVMDSNHHIVHPYYPRKLSAPKPCHSASSSVACLWWVLGLEVFS